MGTGTLPQRRDCTDHPSAGVALKILHAVEMYDPITGGAQEVVRQISTRLVRRGHDVTVVTSAGKVARPALIDGVRIREFAVRGNGARGLTGDVVAYRDFVMRGDFDIVMLYAAQQWSMDALLPVLGQLSSCTVVAPCGFSGLGRDEWRSYFEALPGPLRLADRIVCHSSTYQDAVWLDRHGLAFEVIPNGADEERFGGVPTRGLRAALGIDEGAPLVLLVGGQTGLKGHTEAMRVFLDASATEGGVLVLNGNHPARVGCGVSCAIRSRVHNLRHRDRRIILANLGRRELVCAYFEADLLLSTSRVECSPLVLFEAAAAGLPFVASNAGNSAEIADWTGCGRVVDWPRGPSVKEGFPVDQFAREVDALLRDPAQRESMGAAGRQSWSHNFTWDHVVDQYERLYKGAVAARSERQA